MVDDPEELARKEIDALLNMCGSTLHDKRAANLAAGRRVAMRELTFRTKLQFNVGDLKSDDAPFSELAADALEQSKNISFQDMKGIARALLA